MPPSGDPPGSAILAAAAIAGALLGALGVFLVLRRMAFFGHGVAHAALGGATAALLVSAHPLLGAAVATAAASAATLGVSRIRPVPGDAALGLVTTTVFALGLSLPALGAGGPPAPADLEAILFGGPLSLEPGGVPGGPFSRGGADLALLVGAAILAGIGILFFYRPLVLATLDREAAEVQGIRTARVDLGLGLLLALAMVASLRLVGALLVVGATVAPALAARMLAGSFPRLLALASTIGAATGLLSIPVASATGLPAGAVWVLLQAGAFALAVAFRRLRGPLRSHAHPHRHGAREHAHPHAEGEAHGG